MRRPTFLNNLKFADLLILRIKNYGRVGRGMPRICTVCMQACLHPQYMEKHGICSREKKGNAYFEPSWSIHLSSSASAECTHIWLEGWRDRVPHIIRHKVEIFNWKFQPFYWQLFFNRCCFYKAKGTVYHRNITRPTLSHILSFKICRSAILNFLNLANLLLNWERAGRVQPAARFEADYCGLQGIYNLFIFFPLVIHGGNFHCATLHLKHYIRRTKGIYKSVAILMCNSSTRSKLDSREDSSRRYIRAIELREIRWWISFEALD